MTFLDSENTVALKFYILLILGIELKSGRNQGKGQALYSSISFGLGGALGSLWF